MEVLPYTDCDKLTDLVGPMQFVTDMLALQPEADKSPSAMMTTAETGSTILLCIDNRLLPSSI